MKNLTAFFALIKNDIKLFLIDWKAIALLLLLPFLFIAFFAYALTPYLNKSNFVEPFVIALVDNEDTAQTRILSKQIDEIEIFKDVLRVDQNEAQRLLDADEIASIIIIPPGFSDSVVIGENKPVTVIGNKSMPLQSLVVKNLMISAANLVSAGQSAINTIYHYSREAGLKGEELEKVFNDSTMAFFMEALARKEIYSQIEASSIPDITPMEYFTAALIVVFLMFAGMPGMKMLVTERSLGLTRRLEASPVGIWQVVLSKFVVSLSLCIIQFSIIVVLTTKVFRNYWGAPPGKILMLFGAVIFAISSWSVFVSSVSKTPASADVIGNLGIMLMAVIGGNIYPLSTMPGFIRKLSKLTINRWAMEGFMIIFSGNELLSLTNHVYVLIAIGLAMLILSIAVLKVQRR